MPRSDLNVDSTALDPTMFQPASPGASVTSHEGGILVLMRGLSGTWGAFSPPIEEWCRSSGIVPSYPAVLHVDLQAESGEIGVSRVTDRSAELVGKEHVALPEFGRIIIRLRLDRQAAASRLLLFSFGENEHEAAVHVYSIEMTAAPTVQRAEHDGLPLDVFALRVAAPDAQIRFQPEDHSVVFKTGAGPGSWGAVSLPLEEWYSDASVHTGQIVDYPAVLRIEAQAVAGVIGLSLFADGTMERLGSERALRPQNGKLVVWLYVDAQMGKSRLMLRNFGTSDQEAVGHIFSVHMAPAGLSRADLIVEHFDSPLPCGIPMLCVTHSERVTDLDRCSLTFLQHRYRRLNGIENLAPFETLPRIPDTRYQGAITLWCFKPGVWSEPLHVATLRPRYKPQHAIWYKGWLWILGAEILDVYDGSLNHIATIKDPWMADAHTIIPDGKGTLLVTCSGSDAILFIDDETMIVKKAWRMPEKVYGHNYRLQRTDSVIDHFIENDFQLTHINSAYPWSGPRRRGPARFWPAARRGGIVVSTLIQGAIGWLSSEGSYREIVRGLIGCHGVRVDKRTNDIYFTDSTTGTVVFIDDIGRVKARFATRSVWLHDAQQIEGAVFALAVSDRNVVEISNIDTKELLTTIDSRQFGQGPQFLYYGM